MLAVSLSAGLVFTLLGMPKVDSYVPATVGAWSHLLFTTLAHPLSTLCSIFATISTVDPRFDLHAAATTLLADVTTQPVSGEEKLEQLQKRVGQSIDLRRNSIWDLVEQVS